MDDFEIDLANQQSASPVDVQKLEAAIRAALVEERVARAVLSVTIVDNAAIHELNRDHLQHDFATDVISFQLEHLLLDGKVAAQFPALRSAGAAIEGEIVASAEMAVQICDEHGSSPDAELTLYVLHGLLHICGYDDLSDVEAAIMRARERAVMLAAGFDAPMR